jgi:hypothetical protein
MELGSLPTSAYFSVKQGLRGPVGQRVRELTTQDSARWTNLWNSPEGRDRRRQAVERLTRKK